MKQRHRIEFSVDRKHPRQLWAQFEGTRKAARRSARNLARELKLDGAPRPRVWVNGKRVMLKRRAS